MDKYRLRRSASNSESFRAKKMKEIKAKTKRCAVRVLNMQKSILKEQNDVGKQLRPRARLFRTSLEYGSQIKYRQSPQKNIKEHSMDSKDLLKFEVKKEAKVIINLCFNN